MSGFMFDNLHSYDNFDIIVNSVNRSFLPSQRKREFMIPGKHGTYDFGNNTFDNIIIPVIIQYVGITLNDLRLRTRDIAAWLSQTSYKKLVFDDEPDKYYLAKIYSDVGLENFFRIGKSSIQFECQPFALSVITSAEDICIDDGVPLDSDVLLDAGDDYTYTLDAGVSSDIITIAYNGNAELGLGAEDGAQFSIIVTGTFTVFSISMNGKTLTYTENCTAQTITIDNVNATVKNGVTNKLFNTTGDVGEFLKLIPGDNVITITKTGGDMGFTFDFRSQFI